MSDIYLELKTRIPVVTHWVEIGSERLQEAQAVTGLSNERLARKIPVSTKTWERWKKRGAIPADSLDAAARVLGIELHRPQAEEATPTGEAATVESRLATLEELVRDVASGQRDLEGEVRDLAAAVTAALESSQGTASSRRRASG